MVYPRYSYLHNRFKKNFYSKLLTFSSPLGNSRIRTDRKTERHQDASLMRPCTSCKPHKKQKKKSVALPNPLSFFLAFFRVALSVLSRPCYSLNPWNRLLNSRIGGPRSFLNITARWLLLLLWPRKTRVITAFLSPYENNPVIMAIINPPKSVHSSIL